MILEEQPTTSTSLGRQAREPSHGTLTRRHSHTPSDVDVSDGESTRARGGSFNISPRPDTVDAEWGSPPRARVVVLHESVLDGGRRREAVVVDPSAPAPPLTRPERRRRAGEGRVARFVRRFLARLGIGLFLAATLAALLVLVLYRHRHLAGSP